MPFTKSILVAAAMILASAMTHAAPVNVNSASATEIAEALTGIGEKKAQAIVEYRQQNGPFRSAEDLMNVSGIGERTVELNRADIQVEKP